MRIALPTKLADIWAFYERMGLMVGTIWVNPTELQELHDHPDVFDRLDPARPSSRLAKPLAYLSSQGRPRATCGAPMSAARR